MTSRKPTATPIEVGPRSIAIAHLGNIAMMTGRDLKWDPDRQEITNDPSAKRFLNRAARTPGYIEHPAHASPKPHLWKRCCDYETGQLQNLGELGFSSNQIDSQPRETNSLKELSLSLNRLRTLPAVKISQMENLQEIYLEEDKLDLGGIELHKLRRGSRVTISVKIVFFFFGKKTQISVGKSI